MESFELPIKLNEAVLPSLDLLVQARGREVPLGHEGDQVGQLVLGLPGNGGNEIGEALDFAQATVSAPLGSVN
jgi:hypothetical protein